MSTCVYDMSLKEIVFYSSMFVTVASVCILIAYKQKRKSKCSVLELSAHNMFLFIGITRLVICAPIVNWKGMCIGLAYLLLDRILFHQIWTEKHKKIRKRLRNLKK